MPSWSWPEIKQRLQCPVDEDADYENTTWCNRDLIPIPPERRTYGVWSYFGATFRPLKNPSIPY
ncbi:hypothetical protein BJY01DRAFT_208458 [Aspergillus pseudoustus]|uniref:Uncharacterized protein n=1 Tax=Aspergillus pseudoustus TaxID=1810923 RepID=A0ABR4KIH9_9EURO